MKKESIYPIDVVSILGREILAGRRSGETDFDRLRGHLRAIPEDGVAVLDLAGAKVLSSSYFLGGMWPLWRSPQGLRGVYPVLANANESILDEIVFVLESSGNLIWHLQEEQGKSSARLLGQPDSYDRDLFDLILRSGSLSARDLHANDSSIGVTAWSTRLSQHHHNRLLRRAKLGKQQIYTLPWT